jgi:hypothetical protein
MSRYVAGRKVEYKVRKLLEKSGHYVIRSAGSKGIWDLVALNGVGIKLIQVKRLADRKGLRADSAKSIFSEELDAMKSVKLPSNAMVALVVYLPKIRGWAQFTIVNGRFCEGGIWCKDVL